MDHSIVPNGDGFQGVVRLSDDRNIPIVDMVAQKRLVELRDIVVSTESHMGGIAGGLTPSDLRCIANCLEEMALFMEMLNETISAQAPDDSRLPTATELQESA